MCYCALSERSKYCQSVIVHSMVRMAENMVKITKLQKREESRSALNSEAYSVHQRNLFNSNPQQCNI